MNKDALDLRANNPSQRLYIEKHFAPESPLHREILTALKQDQKAGINISSVEGQMLAFFVKAFSVKKILEIGTLYGYSTLWMAQALKNEGHLITLEKDLTNFQKAQRFLKSQKNVEVIHADAKDALETLKGDFDLIFIDADKEGYKLYLDWAESHIHPGSLIIGDNTFLFGHIYGKGSKSIGQGAIDSMKAFNLRLSDTSVYESMLIPTVQGMTVARKI